MQVKLWKKELEMFPDILKGCYEKAVERKETCYVMLDLVNHQKGNRFVYGPAPHAGYMIVAEVSYTSDIPGLTGKAFDKIVAYVAWPLVCPDVPHGNGHAGGRYTDYGHKVCTSIPCEVW